MNNRVRKLSDRVLAMILTIVMVIGMLPMSTFAVTPSTVTTDLSEKTVIVDEYVEFTVTTTANDDLEKDVFGYFDFNGGDWSAIESLKYKESKDGKWYDLPQGVPFGPPGVGFPMKDASSTFQVKFKTAGTYTFSVSMRTVEGDEELCSLNKQVTVEVKPSELTTDITEQSFVVGTPTEFTYTTIPNGHEDLDVFGKFTFSDWDAVETLEYWGVMENQWLPLSKDVLFGPPGVGFPMLNATSNFRVTFKTAGTYTCKVEMILASDQNVVLSKKESEITVTETMPPVVGVVNSNPATWAQSTTITGTVSDEGGSGIAKVVYSENAEYAETHTAATLTGNSFSFAVDKNATYYIWAIDGNGNVSEAAAVEINNIDREDPTLTVTANPSEWINREVEIAITANDTSGVSVKYNNTNDFDNAQPLELTEGEAKLTVDVGGTYYVWAVDAAGNKSESNVAVKIDKNLPTVVITTVPSATWTNQDVTIEGTVMDADSGIEKVVYSQGTEPADAMDVAVVNGAYNFTVTENGTYKVWAKDIAGNDSEVASITIENIDKDEPEITEVSAPSAWTNGDVTVKITAVDAGNSGIAKVVYGTENAYNENLFTASLNEDGSYTFAVSKQNFAGKYYVWAVDNAGNVSAAKEVSLQMDITAPAVDSAEATPATWTNGEVTVTGQVSDQTPLVTNSGIAKVVYGTTNVYADADGNAEVKPDGSFSFVIPNTAEYNGEYYVWAVDNAGNPSEAAAVKVQIDLTAPVVDEITAAPAHSTNQNVNISGKVSDLGGSAVKQVVYSTTESFDELTNATLNEDGSYNFAVSNAQEFNGKYYVWAIDNAGNHTNTPAEVNVHIDTQNPTAKVTVGNTFWEELLETITFGLYHKDDITVTIESNDNDSGVQNTYYIRSNVPMTRQDLEAVETWEVYTNNFTIVEQEHWIVYAKVVDNAGNYELFSSDGVVLDKTAAKIEMSHAVKGSDPKVTKEYYNGDVTVDIAVTEGEKESGIKTIEYWVTKDGGEETVRKTLYSFGYDDSTYDKSGETQPWEITGSDVADENGTYQCVPTRDMLKKSWNGQIEIPADQNNSSNVVVTVQVTDNAGVVSTKELKLDIDVTAPVVEVTYENEGNKFNEYYFDGNRTATIKVIERSEHFVEPKVYINQDVAEADKQNYIHITAKNVEFAPEIVWMPVDGGYEATIAYNVDANYTFDMQIMDKASNPGEIKVNEDDAPRKFTVDKVNPEGTLTVEGYSTWEKIVNVLTFGIYSKEEFKVSATAGDATSPIQVAYYKATGEKASVRMNGDQIPDSEWNVVELDQLAELLTVGASEQFVVYLKITDKANRVTYVSTDGLIVESAESGITMNPSAPVVDNGEDDVYGYYNGDVTVDITVTEGETHSGIKTIEYWVTKDGSEETVRKTLYSFGYDGAYNAEHVWEITGSDVADENGTYQCVPTWDMLKKSWKGQIVIPADQNNSSNVVVTVQVTDNAGNISTKEIKLDIDVTAPVVEVTYENEGNKFNEYYFDGNRTATITVTERSEHFAAPKVYINKDVAEADKQNYIHITAMNAKGKDVEFTPEIVWMPVEGGYVATIAYDVDANYTFDMKIMDKASNPGEIKVNEKDEPNKFTVDTTDPTGSVQVVTKTADKIFAAIANVLSFGLYDAKRIQISAVANDVTSPVKVEYYKHSGKDSAFGLEAKDIKPENWIELAPNTVAYVEMDKFMTIRFYEQAVVYLKLTDNANNVTYIRSDAAILDNLPPNMPEITVRNPEQSVNGIYNGDVILDVAVEEKEIDGVYSGLKNVRYEVYNYSLAEADQKTQSGDLMNFANENPEHADLVKAFATDTNNYIRVDAVKNNSNDVVVWVFATDNAGNEIAKSIDLKIDVTAPQIEVSYDRNNPDSGSYYNSDRTATIRIYERNFDPEKVNIQIENVDEASHDVLPDIPTEWKQTPADGNGDLTVYEATIAYTQDGDYVFSMECEDLAGWTCGNMAENQYDTAVRYAEGTSNETAFTIDKTLPVVRVSYDNNAVTNDHFFNAYRTATITITEHNFPLNDIARVIFTHTAARGGVTPNVAWSHNGDTHIATFQYNTDGDYTFDVSMSDLAGNNSDPANFTNSVAGKSFTIDTTYADMITIGGVENGKAYGYEADVIPTIDISDINLENYTVTLTGVQKNTKIDLTEQINKLLKTGTEQVTGTFDIFDLVQSLDGIYTLSVSSQDKAGNRDAETVTFTVNRFGSVYLYDQYLMDLIAGKGTYVKSVTEDLVITEFNADKLVTDSLVIEITCDGRPLDNVIYSATPEINDQVAVGESGWYQYKYTISKDNFASDGVYKISVSSKDATGNTPENSRYDDMGIAFFVDSTLAEISSITGLEEAIVDATEQEVKFTVYDTMGIKSIKVYVDGELLYEETDFSADMNSYTGKFTLTEKSSAQTVQIVVEDLSGNITDTDAETFTSAYVFNKSVTVSTNIFVRWYANKPLFWGSMAGIAAVVIGLGVYLGSKRKKEETNV